MTEDLSLSLPRFPIPVPISIRRTLIASSRHESVLRPWLFVVGPDSEIVVRIGFDVPGKTRGQSIQESHVATRYSRINVLLCWEFLRVASRIDGILGLVHAHILDAHRRRERQVLQVDLTEVVRDGHIHDDILGHELSTH